MNTLSKILPFLLLASALGLSSCVNETKNPAKTQGQDTTKGKDSLTSLAIFYSIPDSNVILSVAFHASLVPMQKNFRFDWDFDDGSVKISRFDTNTLIHYFKSFGLHIVSLSVIDTQAKTVVSRIFDTLVLNDNAIDTNYLHGFTHMRLFFQAKCLSLAESDSIVSIYTDQQIIWQDKSFRIGSAYDPSGMGGEISLSGNRILSAWYELGGYSYQAVGYHGFDVAIGIKYIDFQSLNKSVSSSADSLVFLSIQNDVPSKITSLLDTAFHVYTTFIDSKYLSPGRPGQSKETIFTDREPSPILKVIFYK